MEPHFTSQQHLSPPSTPDALFHTAKNKDQQAIVFSVTLLKDYQNSCKLPFWTRGKTHLTLLGTGLAVGALIGYLICRLGLGYTDARLIIGLIAGTSIVGMIGNSAGYIVGRKQEFAENKTACTLYVVKQLLKHARAMKKTENPSASQEQTQIDINAFEKIAHKARSQAIQDSYFTDQLLPSPDAIRGYLKELEVK